MDTVTSDETANETDQTLINGDDTLGDYGDWVRTHDGLPATIIHAQPAFDGTTGKHGHVYTLMLRGGQERTYYHWSGDDHLVVSKHYSPEETVALFTVIDPDTYPAQ